MRRNFPTPPPADRVETLLRPPIRPVAPAGKIGGVGAAAPGREAGAAGAAVRVSEGGDLRAAEDVPEVEAASSAGGGLQVRRGRARHRSADRPPPPRLSLPGPLREVRVRPAWGAVLGLVLVGLVITAVLGVRAWGATTSAVPTPVSPTSARTGAAGWAPSPATGGAASTGGAVPSVSGGATGSRPSGVVVVHIIGQVKTPGVVRLETGARVEDAVRAAGGTTAAAQLAVVNLARVLADGEQIIVPAQGDPTALPPPPVPPGGAVRGGGAAGSGPTTAGQLIDLNTADVTALDTLPGVGPVIAQKIVDWRSAHGRFTAVEELAEVPGIGAKLLAQIAPLVRV